MRVPKRTPADTAAQFRRLLALVPRIADGEAHSIEEIAELVGVDAKTVVGDLMLVGGRCGTPGGFIEGLEVFIDAERVAAKTDHFLRPMRLTTAELRALDLGLGMIRAEGSRADWPAIDRARERIRKAATRSASHESDESPVLASSAGAPPHLGIVRKALRERRKLWIMYQRGSATEPTERIVRPYRLILAGPVWYLVAYCEKKNEIRVFRVDRIEEAELLHDKNPPPDLELINKQLASGPVFVSDPPVKMRVRFSPKIARWLQEHETGMVEPEGSFVVEYPLADLEWGVRHVLQYGPEAEIIEPPEARAAIVERLRAIIAG